MITFEEFKKVEIKIGKEMPVILNLEPRKLRGFMSEGMMLAADGEGSPVLLHPEREVPPGSEVR